MLQTQPTYSLHLPLISPPMQTGHHMLSPIPKKDKKKYIQLFGAVAFKNFPATLNKIVRVTVDAWRSALSLEWLKDVK